MRFKNYFLALIMIFPSILVRAQDPSFSQIDNTLSYYHASNINLNEGYSLNTAHRRQWNKVPGGFTSTWLQVSFKPKSKNTSFGINMMHDQEGAAFIKTQNVNFVIRQRFFRTSKIKWLKSMTGGLYVGIIRKSLDWSQLVFSDQIDPVFGIYQNSSQQQPNIDGSLFYDSGLSLTSNLVLRIKDIKIPTNLHTSINHFISRGNESLQGLSTKYPSLIVVSATGTIQKNNFYGTPLIKPSIQWELQTKAHRIKIGSIVGYINSELGHAFYFGTYFSTFLNFNYQNNSFAIIPVIGYEKSIKNYLFSFGYSFDVNLKGLNVGSTGGIHELTLAFTLNTGNNRTRNNSNVFIKCPEF